MYTSTLDYSSFYIIEEMSMVACLFFFYRYIYTDTYTRAFKVQNLTSANCFTQSSLYFLPELGYVYIC